MKSDRIEPPRILKTYPRHNQKTAIQLPDSQIACQLAFDSIHAPSILVAAAISCSPHFGTCRQS